MKNNIIKNKIIKKRIRITKLNIKIGSFKKRQIQISFLKRIKTKQIKPTISKETKKSIFFPKTLLQNIEDTNPKKTGDFKLEFESLFEFRPFLEKELEETELRFFESSKKDKPQSELSKEDDLGREEECRELKDC